ncbi:MAG: hypothetical protein HRT94_06835 [Alphaproteobacteria bacterium]|nr:hypothetical protein [Alphaproteobacteria bacterium]
MSLKADLARAATQLVSPEVSGIAPSVSHAVDNMLTQELSLTNTGPTLQA